MIYLLETNLSEIKPIAVVLTKIYGIGTFRAYLICKKLGFSRCLALNDLSINQKVKIVKLIESLNLFVTNDLKKFRISTLKKLKFIQSHKGLRRYQDLPVRGQRTRINAKSLKIQNLCTCLLYYYLFLDRSVQVYSAGISGTKVPA